MIVGVVLMLTGCRRGVDPQEEKMHRFVDQLMAQMTLEEKLGQLNLPVAGDIVTGEPRITHVGERGGRAAQSAAESHREHLWRYNPELEAEGKTRSDSKEPQWDKFQDYLKGEVRFASVAKQFPKEADELFAAAQENAQWRYKSYLRMLGTAW